MSCPAGSLRSATAHHVNWVDKVGGLPRYIERIACHIHFDHGHPTGFAIASAVNDVKEMCVTGHSNFGQVGAGPRAEACAASAQWEAKKAAAHALGHNTDLSHHLQDNRQSGHGSG